MGDDAFVHSGQFGTVRKVLVEYHQGWLARGLGKVWKNDPARAGAAGTLGVGLHAENLTATVTGLELGAVCADLTTFTKGGNRGNLDDAVLLRFTWGPRGALLVSRVAAGEGTTCSCTFTGQKGGSSGIRNSLTY